MLMSELKNIKFDLYDYPDSDERRSLSEKLACDSDVILSRSDADNLSDSDFALIIKEGRSVLRKYPLCNKKTAAISRIFLDAHKSDIPETLYKLASDNITRFLTRGDILNNEITTQELFAREKQAGLARAESDKAALSDSDFALVIKTAAAAKTRLYPINNENNCKLASEYFSKNLKAIPLHLRHEFARSIVVKCAQSGFSPSIITSDIRSYCNNRLNPDFDIEIDIRKDKLASAKAREALDVLKTSTERHSLQKIANLLYKFDKEFGLDKYYNKSFSDAYRAVFDNAALTKQATGVSIVGDYDIDPANLAAMPYTGQLQQLFSESDFNAIKTDPAAYDALPTPYKQAIQQQMG